MIRLLIALIFSLTFSNGLSAKIYDANDILAFTRINSVSVSPDGKQVAYVTRVSDQANDLKWRYHLNLKDNNGNIKEITQSENISSVSWSPDGKNIAYIAPNKDQQVISAYNISNDKIIPIVSFSGGIVTFRWSPSGKQIAFIGVQGSKKKTANKLIDVPTPPANLRLYLTDVENHSEIKPITNEDLSISYEPFTKGFSWSPDGQEIAFAYQPSANAVDDLKCKIAILSISTLKTKPVEFCKSRSCRQPLYSPDGDWLAFTASIPATGKSKALLEDIDIRNKVCLVNKKNQTHCLQDTYNVNPWLIAWNANNHAVYAIEGYKSQGLKIYELNENEKIPVKLISTHKDFIEPLTLSINSTNLVFGFGYESVDQAPEVFTATANDFILKKITQINEKYNLKLGLTQILHWRSTDGVDVEGLLITPVNYDPKRKYPLYVDVHGGPSGAQSVRYLGGCDEYDEALIPTACPPNILSLGYIILQVNYRGSIGYGLDFRVKNFADLGGGDYHDIMSGIDNLIQKGIVDTNKIAIGGWSYGGYLSAWAASQTNRFYKIIDGDGMSDYISYAVTSDNTDFGLRYLGTYFWDDSHLYWNRSPIAHVKNITKPLLILHGEMDIRVPLTQGKELFTALTLLNRPVKMLIAPNQGHVPTDPEIFSKELDVIDQWLSK